MDSVVVEKVERAKSELRLETAEMYRLEAELQQLEVDSRRRVDDARALIAQLSSLISSRELDASTVAKRRREALERLEAAQSEVEGLAPVDSELCRLEHAVSLMTNITHFEWVSDSEATVMCPASQTARTVFVDAAESDFDQAQRFWDLIDAR